MRELTSLIHEFNDLDTVVDVEVPVRNWNLILDDYNSAHKRKFDFSALQCRWIIEKCKRGVPAYVSFQALGISKPKFQTFMGKAKEMEDKILDLTSKPKLTDEEFDIFQALMRHPARILAEDILRADGIASIADWELFNDKSTKDANLLAMKMRSRFRDDFSDKDTTQNSFNVQINIGEGLIENL